FGPWPEPAGGSCQSETFDCQPNSADANGGMALFSSSAALGSANATIKPATALPGSMDDRSADAVSMERIIVSSRSCLKIDAAFLRRFAGRARIMDQIGARSAQTLMRRRRECGGPFIAYSRIALLRVVCRGDRRQPLARQEPPQRPHRGPAHQGRGVREQPLGLLCECSVAGVADCDQHIAHEAVAPG